MSAHTETAFEAAIERGLVASGGYQKRQPGDYDEARALFPEYAIGFIQDSQPKRWAQLETLLAEKACATVLDSLSEELALKGALHVLRYGFKCYGKSLRLAYFRPNSGMNPESAALYAKNRLTITRQVAFSFVLKRADGEHRRCIIDVTLAVNGLPVVTAELKNPLTGQRAADAMTQYRRARSAVAGDNLSVRAQDGRRRKDRREHPTIGAGVVAGDADCHHHHPEIPVHRPGALDTGEKSEGVAIDTAGKRFAVIVDEAHSSQSGETANALRGMLNKDGIETAIAAQLCDEEDDDLSEDAKAALLRDTLKRARQPNLSFFAFTATPKFKTLALFDEPGPSGAAPFHQYAMRQAIEEGFIMDVLANYTTYKRFFGLVH